MTAPPRVRVGSARWATWARGALAIAVLGNTTAACAPGTRRVALPWEGIADVAAPEPMLPLSPPTSTLRGERGAAHLEYPSSFAASVAPDGTIAFPQNTRGRIVGASIVVGATVLATLDDAGRVSGPGLKRTYSFDEKGALLDDLGRGVRITPQGRVRALGGSVRYADVMVWQPEARGEHWDMTGWRALTIVSLLVIENLVPDAVGLAQTSSGDVDGHAKPRSLSARKRSDRH